MKKWSLIFSISVFLLCCNQASLDKNSIYISEHNFQIMIASPYHCYNEIQLANSGLLTALSGSIDEDNRKYIRGKQQIQIKSGQVKIRLHELLDKIKARGVITPQIGSDLSHCVLFIDKEKIVDCYGRDSLINRLTKVILPYIEIDNKSPCDYFAILKQLE